MIVRTLKGCSNVYDLKAALGDSWSDFQTKNTGAGYVAAEPGAPEYNVPSHLVYLWFGNRVVCWRRVVDKTNDGEIELTDAEPSVG